MDLCFCLFLFFFGQNNDEKTWSNSINCAKYLNLNTVMTVVMKYGNSRWYHSKVAVNNNNNSYWWSFFFSNVQDMLIITRISSYILIADISLFQELRKCFVIFYVMNSSRICWYLIIWILWHYHFIRCVNVDTLKQMIRRNSFFLS